MDQPKDGDNVDNTKEFVRFLVGEGWLAHYLDFAGERMLPTMPKLLQAPFWLDPGDPLPVCVATLGAGRVIHSDPGALGKLPPCRRP